MAITPIANYMPVRNSGINFSGRNKRNEQPYGEIPRNSSALSGLKKVPYVVLIAMSPINMQNIQAEPIPEPISVSVPAAAPAPDPSPLAPFQDPTQIGDLDVVKDNVNGYEIACHFIKLDLNGDKRNAEMLAFVADVNSSSSGHKQVTGIVESIVPEPLKDGSYIMEFTYPSGDGTSTISKVCTVPKNIGKYILNLTKTPMGENLSLRTLVDFLIDDYDKRTIDAHLPLHKETNIYYDSNGRQQYVKSENDKLRDRLGYKVKINE